MNAQEKSIIETILIDIGLEPLLAGATDDHETNNSQPVTYSRSGYSGS